MNLRFLQKKDGAKILQQATYHYERNDGTHIASPIALNIGAKSMGITWEDIPMVNEE